MTEHIAKTIEMIEYLVKDRFFHKKIIGRALTMSPITDRRIYFFVLEFVFFIQYLQLNYYVHYILKMLKCQVWCLEITFNNVIKERSEPHRHAIKFGSLLSPPDDWGRQLAAGAGNKDKSEPHHRVIRFGFLLSPPDVWGRQLAAGAGKRT